MSACHGRIEKKASADTFLDNLIVILTKHMVYLGGKDGRESNESINKSVVIMPSVSCWICAVNNTGEYTPLKDVSERQGITLKYLEQISFYPAEAVRIFEKFPWKRRWL